MRRLLVLVVVMLCCSTLFAQQTGSISGRVTATDGSALPGVTVEGRSNVLPQPRVTVTDGNGDYRLPALVPGDYTVSFSLAGMQTVNRKAEVLLGQNTNADAKLGLQGVSESITVTAERTLVDKESTALQSGLTTEQIRQLPITQNFSDLQKFIPGVMYNPDTFRGPSAGASGQDNVYMFDGVNITMPLFGILNVNSSDPNNHDIAQMTVIRGGAKAVDFQRAGGFQIDTVTKSGTNKWSGEASYTLLNKGFVANQSGSQLLTYQQNRTWANVNAGGPILRDRLFFYGSYYRPQFKRSNQANVYGDLPQYKLDRTDWFGKATFTPLSSLLINGSYRNSKADETPSSFGSTQASTTGTDSKTNLKISALEGSWVINSQGFASAKVYDYRNPGTGTASNVATVVPNFAKGTHLDITQLGNLGRFIVPSPISTNAAQSAFVAPFVNQYGFVCPQNPAQFNLNCTPGAKTGGGTVGFGQFSRDDDSFYRKNGQAAFNYTLGTKITHDLHAGFQHLKDSEDRFQLSNGWGLIDVPAGTGAAGTICPANVCGTATNSFFRAQVSQQGATGVPTIHSEILTTNFEINDTIHMNNWTFNIGVLDSQDTLYGQGLKKADNVAGLVASPGTKYLMHRFNYKDMIQPRLGATWAYNPSGTVWASFARYMPPANSDARAASWDRNLVQQLNVYFDQNANVLGIAPNASSSGKWWQDGIKHPQINEVMLGTSRQLTSGLTSRLYTRYRKGNHYLEDTNNTARSDFEAPAGISRDPYVPNLGTVSPAVGIRGAIGSGSSYVIANLDGAFTKYYEATGEADYRARNLTVGGSYTWSHYYGNFDQDNSSFSFANDAAIFIGSSNIGDGPGRQLWNNKYGNLRGDRRNNLKVNSTYALPWQATSGLFFVYQTGQPYQLESVLPYRQFTTSASDTNRYAEPAGTRTSPSHYQFDFNYTQNIRLPMGLNFQLAADVFNLLNRQTGYNFETRIGTGTSASTSSLGFINVVSNPSAKTVPIPDSISDAVLKPLLSPNATFNRADWAVRAPFAQSFYAPRRYQLTARIQF
ncbi:MAG: Plug and carboxypeptidase regulatory-like domain-containing protein [Acidobacteriota bacterium]|nr:Plug and carboxypeptidase regulatory-like domain-containing protein [Acidobacteriota bacterium]